MSLSYDTKLKIKDLFVTYADEETAIEKLRQVLCSIKEFEPYAAFKRIDREDTGYLSAKKICQYLRENGYREINKEDIVYLVRYFD
jgi:Ca2+-binding EF-hand superfamily protein